MKILWPAVLQALAFAVAMAEVMVPSFGLLALLCAGLAAYSWYFIIAELPRGAAFGFGALDLVLIPVGIKIAFSVMGRSPISHTSSLGSGSGLEAVDKDLSRHVGVTAVAEAALRPTGKIRIGTDIFEAQTAGDFVERGGQVKVISVSGSRFQVEKI